MIRVDVVNAHPVARLHHKPFKGAVGNVLEWGSIDHAHIAVIFLDDDELLAMNREFLNHDYYTDVITFPLETDPLEGEIYISIDRAREQAAERGIGLYREVLRLAVHGTLHLLGYDDATPEQRREMSRLEDRFLEME